VAVLMVVLVPTDKNPSKMQQLAAFLEGCCQDSQSLGLPIGAPLLFSPARAENWHSLAAAANWVLSVEGLFA
jgi:hypothetical protein